MENYNGEYETALGITVTSATHQGCLWTYNRFKSLVKTFDFGNIRIYESKSARKGDVLSRDLQIILTGYSRDIITFRECADLLLQRCNNWLPDTQVCLYRAETVRKGARASLTEPSV